MGFLRLLRPGTVPVRRPLVSVLIPVRNEADRIGPCLHSLINQDYPNIEILVLDDYSEDGTAQAVKQFSQVQLLAGAASKGVDRKVLGLSSTCKCRCGGTIAVRRRGYGPFCGSSFRRGASTAADQSRSIIGLALPDQRNNSGETSDSADVRGWRKFRSPLVDLFLPDGQVAIPELFWSLGSEPRDRKWPVLALFKGKLLPDRRSPDSSR